jgi:hypothetical protein
VKDSADDLPNARRLPHVNARPLPLDVDEITPAWLTAALSGVASGVQVNGCEVVRRRHGFTSVIHMKLDLNEAGLKAGISPSIVVKGGFTQYSRTYATSYAREAVGYRDVWPFLNLNMPRVYFADADVEGHQSVIVMEDLNARGVTFGHGLKPLGFDAIRLRLAALAELHAKTWDSPEFKPGGRLHHIRQNAPRMLRMHMEQHGFIELGGQEKSRNRSQFQQRAPFLSPEGWATLWEERMSQNAAASHHFRDLEWTKRAWRHIEDLCERLPASMLHGDTHLGNQYEEPDGTPGFFDGMPRRDPAYFELAYVITCGLDPVDRRNWERALIGYYLAEMARHGVELDFDRTMHYYALFLHQGFLWFIINDPVWQTPAFNTVHVWRFCAAMMDNDTKERFEAAIAAGTQA